MKKTLVTAAAAFAVAAGPALVAVPAVADDHYVISTPATTNAQVVDRVVPPTERPRVQLRVETPGNTQPRGWVYITIKNRRSGKVVEIVRRRYNEDGETFRLPRLSGTRKGRPYVAIVQFAGKGFETDKDRARFRVKKGAN